MVKLVHEYTNFPVFASNFSKERKPHHFIRMYCCIALQLSITFIRIVSNEASCSLQFALHVFPKCLQMISRSSKCT